MRSCKICAYESHRQADRTINDICNPASFEPPLSFQSFPEFSESLGLLGDIQRLCICWLLSHLLQSLNRLLRVKSVESVSCILIVELIEKLSTTRVIIAPLRDIIGISVNRYDALLRCYLVVVWESCHLLVFLLFLFSLYLLIICIY